MDALMEELQVDPMHKMLNFLLDKKEENTTKKVVRNKETAIRFNFNVPGIARLDDSHEDSITDGRKINETDTTADSQEETTTMEREDSVDYQSVNSGVDNSQETDTSADSQKETTTMEEKDYDDGKNLGSSIIHNFSES